MTLTLTICCRCFEGANCFDDCDGDSRHEFKNDCRKNAGCGIDDDMGGECKEGREGPNDWYKRRCGDQASFLRFFSLGDGVAKISASVPSGVMPDDDFLLLFSFGDLDDLDALSTTSALTTDAGVAYLEGSSLSAADVSSSSSHLTLLGGGVAAATGDEGVDDDAVAAARSTDDLLNRPPAVPSPSAWDGSRLFLR